VSGKSNLLEGLELDVAEVRLAGVEAVGPEILVAEFGALRGQKSSWQSLVSLGVRSPRGRVWRPWGRVRWSPSAS